jgi:tetratricopeptide (TPR) repeat protein
VARRASGLIIEAIDPLIGRTIAQYEIVACVGGGAMGVVYRARDTKLGRAVALKFLPQQWSHDEAARQRFMREAQAASATHHPNICTIHDIERADDGQLFIVMAFYEGLTLKQRLESGPIALDEALEIATQIADGLAKAHAQGVVHRDIKPGNVMLTEDGVRILDFGLATFVDALKLTAENTSFGTPAYMSPEQVRGQAADARSDVWAAGVVLYEMLVGHVPFHGSHREAIAHAIRSEVPEPLRARRPEIPEEVEQLVFRALHKDLAVRFQSGRELARTLRHLRGVTVPQDLRTDVVRQPAELHLGRRRRRRYLRRAIGAVAVIGVAWSLTWLLWPVTRVLVAVVPVMNQTGYAELDPYRLALTEELASQLSDHIAVRVLDHERLLQIVRPFRAAGRDVSSREALQAIASHSGANVLIVPRVLRDDGAWRVSTELRDADTGSSRGAYETPGVISSLNKESVHKLMIAASTGIGERFVSSGPVRIAVRHWLRRLFTSAPEAVRPRLSTLDAAAAFERGVSDFEQFEFAAARAAFADAAQRDSRNPLPLAWQSRVAALMRQDAEAVGAADRALALVPDGLRPAEGLFIQAVAAEAHRDSATAGRVYRTLVERYGDEPRWRLELAGFLDRQGSTSDAVNTYHQSLALDHRLVRAHLELCRLYSPSRSNEPTLARQHGERALALFRALGNRGGEAQAHWCLTDVLLVGAERDKARQHADTALAIVKGLDYPFGTARGYNYAANVAFYERKAATAAELWNETLTAARRVGFVLLEARTLMNLGVASEALGQRSAALRYYQESSRLSESLGSEQDAAWNQINASHILIEYGQDPDTGLRLAQDALPVVEKLNDKNFEVLARRNVALHHRYVGRHSDAIRELTRARDVATARNLDQRAFQVSVELARVRFDRGEYEDARSLLETLEQDASGLDRVHVRSELARTRARLGDVVGAHRALDAAAVEMEQIGDVGSRPLLYAARGEVAYESGDLVDAAREFLRSANYWTGLDLPEAASVEARAYAGLIDGIQGRHAAGRVALTASLAQARRMHRRVLEGRCLVFLARLEVAAGRFDEAMDRLNEISADLEAVLNSELRAQLYYWRGQALRGRGDVQAARREWMVASQFLSEMKMRMPEPMWVRVLSRPDIRLLTQGVATTNRSDR